MCKKRLLQVIHFATAGAIVSSCAMNAVQQLTTTSEIKTLEVAFAGLFAGEWFRRLLKGEW